MPVEAYYNEPIARFLQDDAERIIGVLASHHRHDLEEQQTAAWHQQIPILKEALVGKENGRIFLEFYIPRMGKRADAVIVTKNIVFVVEFKVGATRHQSHALDQVEDYALDLKNFHEGSHSVPIVPVLVSTKAPAKAFADPKFANDRVAQPLAANGDELGSTIERAGAYQFFDSWSINDWMAKGYKPTPTITAPSRVRLGTRLKINQGVAI